MPLPRVIGELDVEDRHVRSRVHDAVDRRVVGGGFAHHFDILDLADHLDEAFPHGGGILHHEDFHIGARHVVVRVHGQQYAQRGARPAIGASPKAAVGNEEGA